MAVVDIAVCNCTILLTHILLSVVHLDIYLLTITIFIFSVCSYDSSYPLIIDFYIHFLSMSLCMYVCLCIGKSIYVISHFFYKWNLISSYGVSLGGLDMH